jgi:tetratricopeptide (TPR) repeat protein
MRRLWLLSLTLAAAFALSGCGRKEITKEAREQAANFGSEADFALQIKEWARAEDLYSKASALTPDNGDVWIQLGYARMMLGKRSEAKDAYESALSAYKDACKRSPDDMVPVVRRIFTLVLLGRADDARSVLDEAHAKHPNDAGLNAFVENKRLDEMIADPQLNSRKF